MLNGIGVRLLFVGALTAYAFLAGAYRLFPFYQISYVKNLFVERLGEQATANWTPPSPTSATIVETGVQRLLVKRIALPNAQEEYVGGGALATDGELLYIISSGGALLVIDSKLGRRIEAEVPLPPINRDDLARSSVRQRINPYWFRVAGAYVDAQNDSSHVLYVMHNRLDAERKCITYDISRLNLTVSTSRVKAAGSWRTIFRTQPCMVPEDDGVPGHFAFSGHISGGKIVEWDATTLLITVGDYTYDGAGNRPAWAQDGTVPYGKYVLLDKTGANWRVHAVGARNNMGLFRDSTGTVWSTESGPQGGDELNVVTPGANYRWPLSSFGVGYDNTALPRVEQQGRHDGPGAPVFAWLPSVVPTNLVRIQGSAPKFEAWRGDLVIGSLRDQALHHLRIDGVGRVAYDERIPLGERIRDLVRLTDGRLVLLTDASGYLVLIDDGGPIWEPETQQTREVLGALDQWDTLFPDAPRATASVDSGTTGIGGAAVFSGKCSSCHEMDGRMNVGPPLDGLMGRAVGSRAGYAFSNAIKNDFRRWEPDLLRRYLENPAGLFPGIRMARVALTAAERDSVIAYLSRGTK